MSDLDQAVLLVDDDWRMREALSELLQSVALHVDSFGSIDEYLAFPRRDVPSCLILDVHLPGMSGLEFQARHASPLQPPIVFITGCGDIPSSVAAIKRGAVDFLTKPLRGKDLIAAVNAALDRDRAQRREYAALTALRDRYEQLSPREREVMVLVVDGLLNKQAAAELGISEVTLQIHRRRVMRKMQARSLPELVRMSVELAPHTASLSERR